MVDYFIKRDISVKEENQNYGKHELYTNNYEAVKVQLGWSNEYLQSMEPRTVIAEALIQWGNGSVLGTSTYKIDKYNG